MVSAHHPKPTVLDSHREWIYRDFLKEKLRVQERYWRVFEEVAPSLTNNVRRNESWIIPDALCWRKYLPLFTQLIEQSDSNYRFVLLESAVECMDYRSTSPCIRVPDDCEGDNGAIATICEATAPQERSKLRKLMDLYPGRMLSFCDLSVRSREDDEWESMDYEAMSILERSEQAFLRSGAMLWKYCDDNSLISGEENTIFLVCSDPELIQRFPTDDGVALVLMEDLLKHMHQDDAFRELRLSCEEDYLRRNSTKSYSKASQATTEYLSDDQIQRGLANRTLTQGRLNVSKENAKEAFVVGSNGETYFISLEAGHFNRAIHQDIVVIQPLDKSQWGRPVGRRRLVHHRDDNDDTGNTQSSQEVDSSSAVPSARVVAVTEATRRQYVASLVDLPMNDENACIVIPMDIRIPKIRIKTNMWRRFVGQRLLVQLDSWEVDSNYPSGHCVEILGPVGDLEVEIQCLLYENQLHLQPFSAEALACLPPEGHSWTIPQSEIDRRLDLRTSHRIFSVDPPGCQDIDDTMHARVLPNGDIEIGVHIADVTYFVAHNTPLDIEAQHRGTTFYLVDRRFDMLPAVLSSDLCSLHGGMDRLAVSTIWTFSSDFNTIKSFWYGRTVIHNCQAMTYDQADNILHGKNPDDPTIPQPPPLTAGYAVDPSNVAPLKQDLGLLTRLARKLRNDREELGGAVDLSSGDQGNELKFILDENNNPTKVVPKQQKEIHQTIAELMILANTWVAKTIFERMPDRALLRVHRPAESNRFEDLEEVLKAGRISFDGSSNMALAESLKRAEVTTKSKSVMALFQSLATRAMSEAQYISTGQIERETDLSHYGLGLQKYTHFTSPIRRYADVIVHKQLLAVAEYKVLDSPKPSILMSKGLEHLPSSKTISILSGQGLTDAPTHGEGNLSSVQDAHVSANRDTEVDTEQKVEEVQQNAVALYEPGDVSKICLGLNRQNRMAKLSSFECQTLFLSIYFKDHIETTQAVVTNLRANGFWVYVPRFDMRGPVYLSDMNGNVQVDPALLKLPKTAGMDPTAGFASSGTARMFPSGRCTKTDSPDEKLEIRVSETSFVLQVRMLDVVTVKILSDNWDTRARVAPPRLHLVSSAASSNSRMPKRSQPKDSKSTPTSDKSTSDKSKTFNEPVAEVVSQTPTIYQKGLELKTPPILLDIPLRSKETTQKRVSNAKATMPGRLVFGNFRNPDSKEVKQEISIAEAAEAGQERRNQILAAQARNNEYNRSTQIERDATARIQRLAAQKRSARRAKAK